MMGLAAACYLEIRQDSLKVLRGDEGLELPLERLPNGKLTPVSKEKLKAGLLTFLRQKTWQPRGPAICAIGARGVTMRKLELPETVKDHVSNVLRLQVESEFPLPPTELAWGQYQLYGRAPLPTNGKQEFLVAAVKKDVLEEYAELLAASGLTPVFTLAALARTSLSPQPPGTCAFLDIGRQQSELLCFEDGRPTAVRILSWGGEQVARALSETSSTPGAGPSSTTQAVVPTLTGALDGYCKMLYVSGERARDFAPVLAKSLGNGSKCEALVTLDGEGRSAATLGLRKFSELGRLPLVLQLQPTNGAAAAIRPKPWKWAIAAVLLLLAVLAWPTVEALLLKPGLSKRLAALQADRTRLPVINREMDFLKWLKQNQPPYLDTLFLLAKAAPQGSRVESINMNRRGDLTWRGTLQNAQQLADFRSKIIASGFFTNVAVEEQNPTPDRQKLNIRMVAQWRPPAARAGLNIGPTAEEIEKSKTRKRDQPGAPPGMGAFPPMMGGDMPMPPRPGPSGRNRSGPSSAPTGPGGMPGPGSMPPGGNGPPGQPGKATRIMPGQLPPGVSIEIRDGRPVPVPSP